MVWNVTGGVSRGILSGDHDYNKYILDLRNYIETGEDTVLAFTLFGGIADTELPSYEKFSVGGVPCGVMICSSLKEIKC